MDQHAETIQKALTGSLNIIEQDREKEIISRRFGLNGQKETLEQIGEVLSITRERVRQLEFLNSVPPKKSLFASSSKREESLAFPLLPKKSMATIQTKKNSPPLISLVKFLPV